MTVSKSWHEFRNTLFSVPVSVEAPSLAPGQITTGIPGQQSKPKNVKSDEDKPPKPKKIKADDYKSNLSHYCRAIYGYFRQYSETCLKR